MDKKLIPVKLKVQVILRDKDGNVKDVRCFEHDLLVRGFFRYFYAFFTSRGVGVQDEDGGWRGMDMGREFWTHGGVRKIAIGESDRAPAVSDYRLDLKVVETTTLGITDLSEVANKGEFDITAKLTVPVERDIGEIGLFGTHRYGYYGHEWMYYLIARDIFSPKIHMTTADILDVRYRFTVGIA